MKKYLQKISYRIGIQVVSVLIVSLFLLGIYYMTYFANKLQTEMNAKLRIPASMMSKGLLNYDAVNDRGLMEELAGGSVEQCYLISLNGKIFYSMEKEMEGKNIANYPEITSILNKYKASESNDLIKYSKNSNNYAVSISPVKNDEGAVSGYFFITVDTKKMEDENNNIILTFIIGTLLALIIISATLLYLIQNLVADRIHELQAVFSHIKSGNLESEELSISINDEIDQLKLSFNEVMQNLRDTSSFALEIGQGNYDSTYQPKSENDQMGNALIKMRDNLKLAAIEEKKRKEEDEKIN